MISRGMHASAIYLHSGKNFHFLHDQITSVQGWDKNLANFLTITHIQYSKLRILGLTHSGLESFPSLGYNVESMTGYTFTRCVRYFTSPGIDTR